MLFKSCAIIMFDIQLVWFNSGLEYVAVRKYLTEYYFLCVHVSYHILLVCQFIVCLDSSLVKDGS